MNNWGIQEESTYLGVQCITMSNEMMGNVRWKTCPATCPPKSLMKAEV